MEICVLPGGDGSVWLVIPKQQYDVEPIYYLCACGPLESFAVCDCGGSWYLLACTLDVYFCVEISKFRNLEIPSLAVGVQQQTYKCGLQAGRFLILS